MRSIMPAAALVGVFAASTLAYNNAWRIETHGVHQAVATAAGIFLFLSIGFGALVLYPAVSFRGAGPIERVLACLATPLAWNVKEIVRVSEFFPTAEALYYGLNPLFVSILFGTFAQMGLCEILIRWRLKKRGAADVRVAPALAMTWPRLTLSPTSTWIFSSRPGTFGARWNCDLATSVPGKY
mgnify:CR=1 FL=1